MEKGKAPNMREMEKEDRKRERKAREVFKAITVKENVWTPAIRVKICS